MATVAARAISMFVPGGGLLGVAGSAAGMLAMFAVCGLCLRWCFAKCGQMLKGFDIRTHCGIGRLFLAWGIDKHPVFCITVTVHSAKDFRNTSLLGSANLFVKVDAKYESCKTMVNKNAKWEETRRLTVPQGCSHIKLSLLDRKSGPRQDTLIGSVQWSVDKNFFRQADKFLNTRKDHKIHAKDGSVAGQVAITFRMLDAAAAADDSDVDEEPILEGLDPDIHPALYGEVLGVMGDDIQRNLCGSRKVKVLASVLQGRLERRRASRRLGGGGTEVFAAVCQLLPRGSSDSEPDIDELKRKAQEKGWAKDYVPRKWYWCLWENRKEFEKDPEDPDVMVSVLSITSIHRDVGQSNYFSIKYKNSDGKSIEERYRTIRRDREVWVDGLELLRLECRLLKKAENDKLAYWRSRPVSEQMEAWKSELRLRGYSDEEINQYYQHVLMQSMSKEERQKMESTRQEKAAVEGSQGKDIIPSASAPAQSVQPAPTSQLERSVEGPAAGVARVTAPKAAAKAHRSQTPPRRPADGQRPRVPPVIAGKGILASGKGRVGAVAAGRRLPPTIAKSKGPDPSVVRRPPQ
ncbi:hypothetical protein FOL47_003627 [Perkinsus chesapeaki]|uniref:C2 domain-containing protein n=1 Tax=Perkinsus chesapeaki TaxID=330153 RepID=A0A7J6M8F2_PERCH|nr:hypothetical protein FOL47_003627 [Perkinsus chesapeaki]